MIVDGSKLFVVVNTLLVITTLHIGNIMSANKHQPSRLRRQGRNAYYRGGDPDAEYEIPPELIAKMNKWLEDEINKAFCPPYLSTTSRA